MKAQQLIFSLLMIFTFSTGLAFGGMVDFEAEPLNASYGAAYFHSPNDLIFSEDGVLVYITSYYNDGTEHFTYGRIKNSLPAPANFHNGHIFQLNNVGALFLFGGPGDAQFEFLHFGGQVNIAINGAGVLVADTFTELAGTLAPGVTMSVTTTNVPGGRKGTVTITGDITRLQIGGQEMYIDEVIGGGDLPGNECDQMVTHESLPMGQIWGGDFGHDPGDDMFQEDDIKVYCEEFFYEENDGIFGESEVVMTPHSAFGHQQVMAFRKFSNFYDIGSLEITTATVSFEILTDGSVHNLRVNDGPLIIAEFPNMPAQVDSDISMVVETFPFSGGYRAEITLTGNVQALTVGGETLYLDNLCVTEANAFSAAPEQMAPSSLKVEGNFPNPFNPSTTITFATQRDGVVELSVVDLAGHRVATLINEHRSAGRYEAIWNGRTAAGRTAPTGVYFVQLRSGQHVVSRKITMVK